MKGLTFVVTAEFNCVDRSSIEEVIKKNGGKLTGSVSGKTSYLVYGSRLDDGRDVSQTKKYRDAETKKIKKLNEEEFATFLFEKTGQVLAQESELTKIIK